MGFASNADARPCVQRDADPADRTQLQREHVRRARRRKHAGAGRKRIGRRARRIARRAARRRRSGRARNGDRSRRSGARGGFRRRMSRERPQDHGHGASRIPRARSTRAVRQGAGGGSREGHLTGTVVPDARSDRSAHQRADGRTRHDAARESRVLQGHRVSRRGTAGRLLHCRVCDGARVRLSRALHRKPYQQPDHPAGGEIHRRYSGVSTRRSRIMSTQRMPSSTIGSA